MSPRSTFWRALRATLLGKPAAAHALDCAAHRGRRRARTARRHGGGAPARHVRGERRYFFPVDTAATWRDGWVYLLPRAAFTRHPSGPQWVSPTAVRPIDRLRVTPDDFPLLEKVVRRRQGEPLVRAVARATILRR